MPLLLHDLSLPRDAPDTRGVQLRRQVFSEVPVPLQLGSPALVEVADTILAMHHLVRDDQRIPVLLRGTDLPAAEVGARAPLRALGAARRHLAGCHAHSPFVLPALGHLRVDVPQDITLRFDVGLGPLRPLESCLLLTKHALVGLEDVLPNQHSALALAIRGNAIEGLLLWRCHGRHSCPGLPPAPHAPCEGRQRRRGAEWPLWRSRPQPSPGLCLPGRAAAQPQRNAAETKRRKPEAMRGARSRARRPL
mmetsp:Transcript_59602/g.128023  ORF Transcript_59602/g.128023 Transcript_59602/m.128023 type:complete len:250 (+) Transcript_59602:1248-1997(+)